MPSINTLHEAHSSYPSNQHNTHIFPHREPQTFMTSLLSILLTLPPFLPPPDSPPPLPPNYPPPRISPEDLGIGAVGPGPVVIGDTSPIPIPNQHLSSRPPRITSSPVNSASISSLTPTVTVERPTPDPDADANHTWNVDSFDDYDDDESVVWPNITQLVQCQVFFLSTKFSIPVFILVQLYSTSFGRTCDVHVTTSLHTPVPNSHH